MLTRMEPTAQGVLAKTPLAHMILYCLERKLRGTLVLRPEGVDDNAAADVVTIVDGFPAKIRIADPVEHLGRILLELGAIDDVAYNESLLALGRAEGLQGQILLKRGKIDAATLERGLRTQIVRKFGHLFRRPPSTRYAYFDRIDLLQRYGGPELFPIDPGRAIFANIRTNPSMAHADAAVDRVAGTPLRVRPGMDATKLDLTRAETELLSMIELAPTTPNQLTSAGIADVRSTKLFVYGLLLLKVIEPAVDRAPVIREAGDASARASMPGFMPGPAATVAAPSVLGPSSMGPSTSATGLGRPGTQSGPGVDPQRRAELLEKIRRSDGEDLFELLGLTRGASPEEAKNAYFALVKRWHPDRLPPDLADIRNDVARVFTAMAEAYQVLSDPERREEYLQQEGGPAIELATGPSDQDLLRSVEATNVFQKAEALVEKGNLTEAEPFVNRAFELAPRDPDHVALWSYVQANKAERRESARYDDLLSKLEGTLVEHPKHERARFYRGMILKYAGRMGDAIRDLREVADSNPRHSEAIREVRLYTMRHERDRRQKDEGSASLLGKFAKKK